MGREPENLPDHCILGTKGVEIMDEIAPEKDDIIVDKVRYSAFMGTDLQFVLNGLKVLPHDTLIICGVASNVCVHYTSAEANQRDYRIKVVEDCCAGTSLEEHEAAMYEIKYTQHDALVTLEEILQDIKEYTA